MTSQRHRPVVRVLLLVSVIGLIVEAGFRQDTAVSAQAGVTDVDLDRASGGRTVALRGLTGGRVESVPLEVYVARVLAGEAEPGAPDATMEALAIAIRTYATFNIGRHGTDGFDMCDTTHCQVPRPANATSRRAALATAGRILTYRGRPAEIFYSASCGGRSESASDAWPRSNLPYLRSVPDDVHDDDEPWTLELSLEDIRGALARVGFEGDRLRDIEIEARSGSGRVTRLALEGLRPDVISGDQFRLAISARQMRSTAFSMQKRGERLTFTGRGYGHGVGMCVIGAGRRARRGESMAQILAQYYPGLTIEPLADVPAATLTALPPGPSAPAAPGGPAKGVSVRVPRPSSISAVELERLASGAHTQLSKALGISVAPVTVNLHESLETFRSATDRPWWVSASAAGTTIDLAPAALLAQREGLEPALRVAMAELLVAETLSDRPLWVRVGAGRYFARQTMPNTPRLPAPPRNLQCPSDAELRLAISATAQRDAESRAELCFARAFAQTRNWRSVK